MLVPVSTAKSRIDSYGEYVGGAGVAITIVIHEGGDVVKAGTEGGVADIVVLHVHAVQINFRKLKRSLEVQSDMSVSEWMVE